MSEVQRLIALFAVLMGILALPAWAQQKVSLPTPGLTLPDTSLGQVRYDLVMREMDGSEVRFEEFRDRVLFVNFWATWCIPCIHELPSIERLKESLEGQPVEFLLVSIDDDRRDVRKFLRKHETSLPVYMRAWKPGESTFMGVAIPTTYLVRPGGEMAYRHTGAADWSSDGVKELVLSLIDKE